MRPQRVVTARGSTTSALDQIREPRTTPERLSTPERLRAGPCPGSSGAVRCHAATNAVAAGSILGTGLLDRLYRLFAIEGVAAG